MKKNRFLRAASGLLIATLISTCAISGTYAKYVTEGSVSDTARVADFGVVINAGGTLYSSAYLLTTNTPTNVSAGITPGTASVKVKSTSTDDLVAPGTQSYGNGLSFGVTGTPEVSVTVKADITAEDIYLGTGTWAVMTEVDFTVDSGNYASIIDTIDLYTLSNSGVYTKDTTGTYVSGTTYYYITDSATVTDNYYPVKYSLSGNTTYTGTVASPSAQGVANAIATAIYNSASSTSTNSYMAIYSVSQDYAANTDLGEQATSGGVGLGGLTLSWAWDYSTSTTYDSWDTILGDLIAQENNSGTLDDGSVVVYNSDYTSGSITSYTPVTINSHVVTAGSTGTVAYLQTSFDIDLSVTQID